ncbi:TPA: type II toxin-antitoxin system CcdA family antitoxin [Enterococcus faecium]|nr:type II toxin-antitoxin system CcdA family antitoxin [Enterococcus faecium]
MARPRISESEKKVRVNVTINQGSREYARIVGINLSSLLENAIVEDYLKRSKGLNGGIKVQYGNKRWKSIIEKLYSENK